MRKYKLGLTLAHQYLGQLTPYQRANLKANTSLKFAGGLSLEDARSMVGEMRCDPDFLLSMRKSGAETRFAFAMRNRIDKAVPLTVPLGLIDRQDRVTDEVVQLCYELNRQRYGRKWESEVYAEPIAETQPAPSEPKPTNQPDTKTVSPEPLKPETTTTPEALPIQTLAGRGSVAHRAEQDRIKTLGEKLGYKAEVEVKLETALSLAQAERPSAGQSNMHSYVYVLFTLSNTKIGFEISITTPAEHEVANLVKGLDAGLNYIVATTPDRQHLRAIEQHAMQTLTPSQRPKVLFLLPQNIQALLETHQKEPQEDTIMGYRIITESQALNSDAQQRRKERLEWLLEKVTDD